MGKEDRVATNSYSRTDRFGRTINVNVKATHIHGKRNSVEVSETRTTIFGNTKKVRPTVTQETSARNAKKAAEKGAGAVARAKRAAGRN